MFAEKTYYFHLVRKKVGVTTRFLEVKLVGFDFNLLIALVVIYNFPIPSLVSFTIASLNAEYSGISTMADSQRTTTHGREQKQKVNQDISRTIRKTNYTISFNWSFSVSNI